jgi:hypothetical protein
LVTEAGTIDRKDALRKLAKLHSKYESIKEVSTEAEAQAFGLKIQEMLAKHKISMSEVEWEARDEVDPVIEVSVDFAAANDRYKRKHVAWQRILAGRVADFNFCKLLFSEKTNYLWFVGRRSDAEPAMLTYAYLRSVAEQIADKEYVKYFYECKREGMVEKARGFRQGFLEGFVDRLGYRFREEQLRQTAEMTSNAGSTALVRLKGALREVEDWLKNQNTRMVSMDDKRSRHWEGRRRGAESANTVPLARDSRLLP